MAGDKTYYKPFERDLHMGSHRIIGLASPVAATDASSKGYVDDNFLADAGGTVTGAVTFENTVTISATSGVLYLKGDSTGISAMVRYQDTGSGHYWQSIMQGTDHASETDDFVLQHYNGSTTQSWLRCDLSATTITVAPGGGTAGIWSGTALTMYKPLYMGANGIGNTASVLTFATGATGTATFAGNATVHLGQMILGAYHEHNGQLLLYNAPTGNTGGPYIDLYPADDYDDTVIRFRFLVNEDDLHFQLHNTIKLTLQGSDGTWLFGAAVNMGTNAITNAGAITGAAITGTSFVIGANTLTTTEWANLDGQDQAVASTSSPTFAGLTMAGDIGMDGWRIMDAAHVFVKDDGALGIISDVLLTFDSTATPSTVTLSGGNLAMGGNSITGLSTSGQVQGTATEYLSFDNAGYVDVHWADDDKGLRLWSGSNEMVEVRRVNSANVASVQVRLGTGAGNRLAQLWAGGTSFISFYGSSHIAYCGRTWIFNNGAANYDLIHRSDNGTYLFHSDASPDSGAGAVLIGGATQLVANMRLAVSGHVGITAANALYFRDSAIYAYSRADGYLSFVADTAIELGNQTSGNYFTATATGLTGYGTCRWYETQWLGAERINAPAANQATYVDHGIAGAWQFADGSTKYVHAKMRMPENWVSGTDIILKFGWSSNTVDPGDDSKQAVWQAEFLARTDDEDTTAAAEVTDTVTASASTVSEGMVTSQITLPAANLASADNCIIIRFARLGGDGDDDLGDTAELHGLCLRYLANTLGPSS